MIVADGDGLKRGKRVMAGVDGGPREGRNARAETVSADERKGEKKKKIKNGDVRTEGRMRDDAPRTYAISGGGRLFGA